jgi:hypothetical protein
MVRVFPSSSGVYRKLTQAGYASGMNLLRSKSLLTAVALVSLASCARAENNAGSSVGLSTVQIVEQMESHDQARTEALKHYRTLRQYEVEYKGLGTAAARMTVEVNYDLATGKNLEIVSSSGSKFLIEKVLRRAVESEKEAFHNRSSTALTRANYRFQLVGTEKVGGRLAYVMDVEPLTPSKFLYRGRVWVDATDFAVAKMETQPAKSPSFWISQTLIHYTEAKMDGFWMPLQMRSETSVRVGGAAVMTINYGNYEIASDLQ